MSESQISWPHFCGLLPRGGTPSSATLRPLQSPCSPALWVYGPLQRWQCPPQCPSVRHRLHQRWPSRFSAVRSERPSAHMVAKWKIQDQSPEPRSAWLQSQSRLFYIASKTDLRVSAKWNSSSAWRGGGGPRDSPIGSGVPRGEWSGDPVAPHSHTPLFGGTERTSQSVSRSVVYSCCEPMDYIARQAPLSMGFFRPEYWSGLPCHSPGDLLNPGIKLGSPTL